jgi:hypothetical protein
MEFAFFWFAFAIVVGVAASARGRNGLGWFLLALIISPLIALLLVLVMQNRRSDKVVSSGPVILERDPGTARSPTVDQISQSKKQGSGSYIVTGIAVIIGALIFLSPKEKETKTDAPSSDHAAAPSIERTDPRSSYEPRSSYDGTSVASVINTQFGRVCDAKIEGFFSNTLRLDWTAETKKLHMITVMAAIGKAKESIYAKGIRYLKYPNDVGGYNIIDWNTGEKSSIDERAPYYFHG